MALLGWPTLAQIGTQTGPAPTVIEVVVTDPDGRAIPETEVGWAIISASSRSARRLGARLEVARTDLNGRCSVEVPYAGVFRLTVWHDGYLDADDMTQFEHVETVQVAAGRTARLSVDLIRSAAFQGTVYLEDGRRLPGAVVRLQSASLSWSGAVRGTAPKWLTAKTDAQGNYVFPVVPPARYGMWIAPPAKTVKESLEVNDRDEWTGYGSVVWHTSVEEMRRLVPVDIAPGEDKRGYNVVLRKTRVYPFKGALQEWSREPLLHAKVAIRAEDEDPITLLDPRPVNSVSGNFEFPALPEGRYSLLIYRDEAPDAPPYTVPLETGDAAPRNPGLLAEEESRLVVSVPPWALVGGEVVILDPEPAAAGSGPDGTTSASSIRNFRRSQPATVQVSLTSAGRAVDVRSDALKLESSQAAGSDLMTFPTTLLPPGDYQFNVRNNAPWYIVSARHDNEDLLHDWILPLAQRQYDAPAELVIEIRQGGAALEGVVINERSEPVPNGAMCASAADPNRRRQPGGAFCVRADGDGTYRTRWMSPGQWKVWGFTKKPHDNPASPAFEEKYNRRGDLLTVPEDGVVGRFPLLAIE